MAKYGGGKGNVKAAAGKGRIKTPMECWDGKKQGPSSKNKGFGPK